MIFSKIDLLCYKNSTWKDFIKILGIYKMNIKKINNNDKIITTVISVIILSLILLLSIKYYKYIYYIFINYYVYIYIISSILSTLLFLIAKCYMGFDYFDKFLYIDKNDKNDKNDILYYVLFHIVYYIILGLIFEFNGWKSSIIQTIIVEFLIAYVEKCDYKYINIKTGIYSIIIGLASYFTGSTIRYLLNNSTSIYKKLIK